MRRINIVNIQAIINVLIPYFNTKNMDTNKSIKIKGHKSILTKNNSNVRYNFGYHTFFHVPVKKAIISLGSYDFDLQEEQIYFVLGHELAHVEFL